MNHAIQMCHINRFSYYSDGSSNSDRGSALISHRRRHSSCDLTAPSPPPTEKGDDPRNVAASSERDLRTTLLGQVAFKPQSAPPVKKFEDAVSQWVGHTDTHVRNSHNPS